MVWLAAAGAQGASNFLSRSTAILATVFFITSLSMAYMASSGEKPVSLMEQGVEMPMTEEGAPHVVDTNSDAPVVPKPDTAVTGDSSDAPKNP